MKLSASGNETERTGGDERTLIAKHSSGFRVPEYADELQTIRRWAMNSSLIGFLAAQKYHHTVLRSRRGDVDRAQGCKSPLSERSFGEEIL